MWSDSEATLKMIKDNTTRYRLFFANSLSKIHANSNVNEWRFVDSANNPADCTSRGIAADDDHSPRFLHELEDKWPVTELNRPITINIFAIAAEPVRQISNFFAEIAAKTSFWY